MLKTIAKLEYAIFIAAICMISAGIMGFYVKIFGGNPPLPVEIIHLPIMLGMVGVIVLRLREAVFGLLSVMPYFLLMVLALASYRWSLNPSFTIRESLIAIIYVVYIGTLCWRYSWKELIEGMWTAMLGLSVLSILLFVVMPSVGKSGAPHPDALAGVWMEKNATGQAATFGACLALARFAISPRTFLSSGVSFMIFTLMLLLSTSKTSLVAYMAACMTFGWVFLMRRNMAVFIGTMWTTLLGGGFLVYFIKNNTEAVLGLLGRSSTFTGRSEIWNSVQMSLADRPLLGHGFSGYWDPVYYGKTLSYVWDDLDFMPSHAHNSLIEMKLNLGLIGASILVGAIAVYFCISLVRVRNTHGAYFVLPFTFAALIIACFESVLAYPSNFAGAVIILAAGKMVRPALQSETRSGLWDAIRGFGAQRQNPKQGRAPTRAIGFRMPTPTPAWDRRAASAPAGFASLPPMGIQMHAVRPKLQAPKPHVQNSPASKTQIPLSRKGMRPNPAKGFGRKPKGLSSAVFPSLISGPPPMPRGT